MKIGVILTGFGMEDYVVPCLAAWTKARAMKLGGHEFVICAVSVPFAGFPNETEDNTTSLLFDQMSTGNIDHLIEEPKNIPETTARGMALSWLKTRGVDVVWQVDLDEFYTEDDISNILQFVDMNPWIAAFRLSLKNYVFDDRTYLTEPFTPMRIHRVKGPGLEAAAFWADNNVVYEGTGKSIRDDQLANMTAPPDIAWVRHMTWMSNDRSRRKVAYHEAHFTSRPPGVRCSYRWDEGRGLVFNQDYYRFVGEMLPDTVND